MNEAEFAAEADKALGLLEQRLDVLLEADDDCFDYERKPGGVIEIECVRDGSRLIINAHAAARELWLAARSGGFHFRFKQGAWRDTRADCEFQEAVIEKLRSQCSCAG